MKKQTVLKKLETAQHLKRDYRPTKNLFRFGPKYFLDCNTLGSFSYGWWCVSKVVGDRLVFNEYRYSVTTASHQSVIRGALEALGARIALTIECPVGLQNEYWAESAIRQHAFNVAVAEHKAKYARDASSYLTEARRQRAIIERVRVLGRVTKHRTKELIQLSLKETSESLERKRSERLAKVRESRRVVPAMFDNVIPIRPGVA